MDIATDLERLTTTLGGCAGCTSAGNYVVSMRVDPVEHDLDDTPVSVVKLQYPDAQFCIIEDIDPFDALDVFARNVRYRGDRTHGPPSEIFGTASFESLYETVLSHFRSWCHSADALHRIEFEFDSHPFYPVFWDFAFLFMFSRRSHLWVASSSD